MKKLVMVIAATLLFLAATTLHAYELEGVDIHGFISQGYVKNTRENNFPVSDSGNGSFKFNDFGINFSKQLTPALRMGLQLVAFDRGNYGKDKVSLDWAYGDYRSLDWLGFRVGKIKMPLGLYNETRDNDALRTFIFLPQNEYYEYERDSITAITGGSVYGSVPLGEAGALNYQVQVGTIPITNDGGTALNYAAYISTPETALQVSDISSKTTFVHSLEWRTPLDGLRATFSGLHTTFRGTASGTNSNTGENLTADWQFDSLRRFLYGVEYTYKDLVLAAEYQTDDYRIVANYSDTAENWESDQSSDGWYLSATYRFTDWFELGGYYHEVYADRHSRDGSSLVATEYVAYNWNAWQKDVALALKFDPVPNLTIKVEGHLDQGTWLLSETSGNEKKKWYILATKATFSF